MPTTSSPTITAPHGRIAGLDLIRGGAVALVMLEHGFPAVSSTAGVIGVVAFFALSGYLITGILRRDIDRFGRVQFGRFYRNRVLRLYPPLLLLLAVVAVVTLIADPFDQARTLPLALVVGALYLADVPINIGSRVLSHLWTLASEEQFYLLWPWLLTFGLRRHKMLAVASIAAGAILVALVVSFVILRDKPDGFYQLPTSWCVAMVIGAAAQIWGTPLARFGRRVRTGGAIGALVVLAAMLPLPGHKGDLWMYLVVGPATAVCTVLVIEVVRHWRELPTRWLRPLLSLGTISYAVYLWNWPVVQWLGTDVLAPGPAVASVVITIGAAAVSYWTLERPVARRRARLDDRERKRIASSIQLKSTGTPGTGTDFT